MEYIEKDFGTLIMDNGRIFDIDGEHNGEGYIFKDMESFETGKGLCYVSEGELDDIREELTNLQAVYENAQPGDEEYMTDEEYRVERERIILAGGETRRSIIDMVRYHFAKDYLLTDEQAEYFARDVLESAEWASIETYLSDYGIMDSCIMFDDMKEGGVFTELQREAVNRGLYPAELLEEENR
jgi:hypothetical protein